MQKYKTMVFQLNLFLVFVEGVFVFWGYLQSPSEPQSALLWGYSALKLVILLAVGLAVVTLFLSLTGLITGAFSIQKVKNVFKTAIDRTLTFWVLFLLSGLIYAALFLSDHQLGAIASYRETLRLLLGWFGLVVLQLFVSYILVRGYEMDVIQEYRAVLIPACIALALLAGLVGFIVITRIGLTPDPVYWQDAGVPILLLQVVLVWLAGSLFYFYGVRFNIFNSNKLDWFVCAGIWCLACMLWFNQSLAPSYNSLKPVPPNYETYPFADALLYDVTAHEFLIGKPIPGDFWVKPFYSLFLAFLHLVAGENFGLVVGVQIVLLAVIPVLVYLITTHLGNRPAGLVAALLVVIRERNGIALSNVIQVSHVKLLMSDVFTMGLVALLILLTLWWLRQAGERMLPLMGGILGLLVLTRGHSILLFPVLLCVIPFVKELHVKLRWKNLLLFIAGFAITLFPWFMRHYLESGSFSFQSPGSPYASQMAQIYSLTPEISVQEDATGTLVETDATFSNRKSGEVLEFVLQHPGEVAKFVSSHYLHNTIFSFIYLPHSFRIERLRRYVSTEPFWQFWQGSFQPYNWVMFGFNAVLVALGGGVLWQKSRRSMFIPILVGMGYNLSVSIGRLSGWRFVQPVDWITLIYYSAGLMQLIYMIESVITRKRNAVNLMDSTVSTINTGSIKWQGLIGALVPFVVISSMLVWGHNLFIHSFPELPKDKIADVFGTAVSADPGILRDVNVDEFLLDDNATIVIGQSLYPSFMDAGYGPSNYLWPGYAPRDYSRLGFYLLGSQSAFVLLPMESPPPSFPGGSNVIVLGCTTAAGDIDALAVFLQDKPTVLYTRQPLPMLECPLPEP